MKRFIITLFLIAFFNSILEFIFPWWILGVVCFALCYIARLSTFRSFMAGFMGILFSWLIMILLRDIPNHHILSIRMANLFSLNGNYPLFILICLLIGALMGGLSGMCGRIFRKDLIPKYRERDGR